MGNGKRTRGASGVLIWRLYHGYIPWVCGNQYRPSTIRTAFVSKCMVGYGRVLHSHAYSERMCRVSLIVIYTIFSRQPKRWCLLWS